MYEKLTKCPNFTRYLPEKFVSRIWGGGANARSPFSMPMLLVECQVGTHSPLEIILENSGMINAIAASAAVSKYSREYP